MIKKNNVKKFFKKRKERTNVKQRKQKGSREKENLGEDFRKSDREF